MVLARMPSSSLPASHDEHPADKHPNRLAKEKSPYLLQHANNPVDWYPWGREAFDKARAEDKPIFLSVGYSTCHWCHVMARESFENAEIAAVMNELFVNVKVDREERPDVDRVYMTFVQATTGQRRLAHERLAPAGPQADLRRHVFPAGRPLWAARIRGGVPGRFARVARRPRENPRPE